MSRVRDSIELYLSERTTGDERKREAEETDERHQADGDDVRRDETICLKLTTTGADQIIKNVGSAQKRDLSVERPSRKRRLGGQLLSEHIHDANSVLLSRLSDVDNKTGQPKVNLRICTDADRYLQIIATRKSDCILILGARWSAARAKPHEIEIAQSLLVDTSRKPPISEELWKEITDLPTQEERSAEVEDRLRRWTTFFEVEKKEAEAQQFRVTYKGKRHLNDPSRIRLHITTSPKSKDAQKLSGHRWQVQLEEPGQDGRRVARASVRKYNESDQTLVVDLGDDAADAVRKGDLTIPSSGAVAHTAAGTLSMIRRQQHALDTLKKYGGAQPDLDLLLFGCGEEFEATPFGPVEPLPEDDCLDAEHTNEKQRLAVAQALSTPDTFFLQGPPGTGKTTFIAELCYQQAKRGNKTLVSSQANLAVDNALSRLQSDPSILAVRAGNEDRVEEEGKEFVGERAVRRWLRSIAERSRQRLFELRSDLSLRSLFDEHGAALERWAAQAESWPRKRRSLKERAEELENSAAQLSLEVKEASTLRERLEALAQATQDGTSGMTRSNADALVEIWKNSLPPEFKQTWRARTKRVRNRCNVADVDPWSLLASVKALAQKLTPSGELRALRDRIESALGEKTSQEAEIEDILSEEDRLEQQARAAKRKISDTQSSFDDLRRNVGKWDTSPSKIEASLCPQWHALTERIARASKIQLGSIDADDTDESAIDGIPTLIDKWQEAEKNGRDSSASVLIGKLETAFLELQKKARWPLVGRFYRWRLKRHRSALEETLGSLRKGLQKGTAPVVKGLRDESKNAFENMQKRLACTKEEVEQVNRRRDCLEDEARRSARLARKRVKHLRGEFEAHIDFTDDLPSEDGLSTLPAIKRSQQRTEEALREKAREVEGLQNSIEDFFDEIDQALRSLAIDLQKGIASFQKEIEARSEQAAQEKKEAEEARATIRETDQWRAQIKKAWEEMLTIVSERDGNEVAGQLPPLELIEREKARLDNASASADELQKEIALLEDWVERTASKTSRISSGFSRRFFQEANVIGATCAHAGKKSFQNRFGDFDTVVVDEVSKATPTELLMPCLLGKKVILVGDHRQLAPVFGHQSNFAAAAERLGMESKELQKQLQESLFKERYEYFDAQHRSRNSDASQGGSGDASSLGDLSGPHEDVVDKPGRRAMMLTKQYRMHSQIMGGINQFYGDRLELGRIQQEGEMVALDGLREHGLNISPWVSPSDHMVWIDTPTGGEWEHTQDGPTRRNEKEAQITGHLLRDISRHVQQEGVPEMDVGLTSVYASQVGRLRTEVNRLDLSPQVADRLRVSTVDRFQGMERDIMIVSLVLNREGLPPSKWLRTPERINVAMSRARRLLIIIGSSHNYVDVKGTSEAYSRFFNVARKYGHWVRAPHVLARD